MKSMNSRIWVMVETEQDIYTPNEWNWCRFLSLVSFQRTWGQWRELTCILNLLYIESVLILQYLTQFNSYNNPISQNYYYYFPDEERRLFNMKKSVSEERLQFGLFYIKEIPNSTTAQWKHNEVSSILSHANIFWGIDNCIELDKFDITNHHEHFHNIKIDIFF